MIGFFVKKMWFFAVYIFAICWKLMELSSNLKTNTFDIFFTSTLTLLNLNPTSIFKHYHTQIHHLLRPYSVPTIYLAFLHLNNDRVYWIIVQLLNSKKSPTKTSPAIIKKPKHCPEQSQTGINEIKIKTNFPHRSSNIRPYSKVNIVSKDQNLNFRVKT